MVFSETMIARWCDEHTQEQLALLKELAAIPAPSHHEQKRAEYILNWLKQEGAEKVWIDPALNVVLPFACEGEKPLRVFMAHTDVVFPDMETLPVREENGKLFAPGVGDDTANVTALMMCAKFLLSHGAATKEPVLLVFNSCEEGFGNLKGVRQIMADYQGRIREVVSFDCEYTAIVNRAVGSERWCIQTQTCGGHSFSAFGNPNAIAHLAKMICRLYQQPVPEKENCKTTYNVGTIRGGTSVNTIAQQAEITYEYRSDDYESLLQMRRQFQQILEEAADADAKLTVTLMGERPCGNAVPEAEQQALLDRCSQEIERVTGSCPSCRSASTDANIPLSLGIPAVTFGLYLGGGPHTREEYVQIDSLRTGLEIALRLITPFFL